MQSGMQPEFHELNVRVAALERQNRNLRRFGLAGALLGGAALLSSAAAVTCRTVWAERFVLNDTSNRERAVLTAYETGGAPKLSLIGADGKPALTLGVCDKEGAYVEIPGAEGPVRHTLAALAGEGAGSACGGGKASCKPDATTSTAGVGRGVASAR